MGSADHGHLIGGGGVRVTDVDGLEDVTVRDLDRTRVAGEGAEGIALGGDAEPLPRRAVMHHGEQVQIGALRGIEQVGLHVHHLVQVARHERDGVDRARRYPGRRCACSPHRYPRA